MVLDDLAREVFQHVVSQNALGTGCETDIQGLYAIGNLEKTDCAAAFYEPIMCLVLQGAKEAYARGRVIRYGAGDTLIVSHAVPVDAAVIQASPHAPYTALALRLDLDLLRSMSAEFQGLEEAGSGNMHSLNAAASDTALIDAVGRLFRLSLDPVETEALAPLVLKEIHFRLLRASHGTMLRQLLKQDSPASRISKTITTLRNNYKSNILVADLAAASGMSLSAFHEHFKSVTSTTPLQYQKDLRLLEARQLLISGTKSVAATAYHVGYESPTQFSREYSRKFGMSPSSQKSETLSLSK
ncbi:AraC family transcriptional regulator [Pseudophaeobacter sp.]|uniref:AraC family transcriptional regulator n=1 Tax=Pseudophaeobacter sp. TaxID=1971739 RepID=UPI00329930BA